MKSAPSSRQREALAVLAPEGRTLVVNASSGSFGGHVYEGAVSVGIYVAANTVTSTLGRGWIALEREERRQRREYLTIALHYQITEAGRAAMAKAETP